MKKGLFDYAEKHPAGAPPQEIEIEQKSAAERQAKDQEAADLKESISHQIEQGNAPQYILYTAIKAIGLLTSDDAWSEKNLTALDSVYDDLRQESFLVDNAAIAKARLDEMRTQYNAKLKRQINAQLNGYRKLSDALTEAYRIVNIMDQKEEQDAEDPGGVVRRDGVR